MRQSHRGTWEQALQAQNSPYKGGKVGLSLGSQSEAQSGGSEVGRGEIAGRGCRAHRHNFGFQ